MMPFATSTVVIISKEGEQHGVVHSDKYLVA